jgi:hypothetical protein
VMLGATSNMPWFSTTSCTTTGAVEIGGLVATGPGAAPGPPAALGGGAFPAGAAG